MEDSSGLPLISSTSSVDAKENAPTNRDLFGELRAMVFGDSLHMLMRGAPGLSEATRTVIASTIALRVYTHARDTFMLAALGPSTADDTQSNGMTP